jgi:hypothetical protein
MTLSSDQYEKDANLLRKAMKGWGTDEKIIIELTAKRTNADRMKIKTFYKSSFGRDVEEDLDDELGGDLRKVVLGMFKSPVDYDCFSLHKAMKGMGTDEDTLIEILGSRTNEEISLIKPRFKELYKKDLEEEIMDETSGDLKRLLVSLLQCNRSEVEVIDQNIRDKLDKDLKDLYNAGEGQVGTDEEVFNKIFTNRSPKELRHINSEYAKHTGKNLKDIISDEFSGDIKKLLLTILHCCTNITDYFAHRIRGACKGLGTNDAVLIRCMITRDEIDLQQIKKNYKTLFGLSLYDEIKDECSGDYKLCLLAIAATDN